MVDVRRNSAVRRGLVDGRLPAFAADHLDERVDQVRVEVRVAVLQQDFERLFHTARRTVRPGRGQAVEGVDDPDDPGEVRDLLTCQTGRVAGAVVLLVVVQNRRLHLFEERDVADQLDTAVWFDPDKIYFVD